MLPYAANKEKKKNMLLILKIKNKSACIWVKDRLITCHTETK